MAWAYTRCRTFGTEGSDKGSVALRVGWLSLSRTHHIMGAVCGVLLFYFVFISFLFILCTSSTDTSLASPHSSSRRGPHCTQLFPAFLERPPYQPSRQALLFTWYLCTGFSGETLTLRPIKWLVLDQQLLHPGEHSMQRHELGRELRKSLHALYRRHAWLATTSMSRAPTLMVGSGDIWGGGCSAEMAYRIGNASAAIRLRRTLLCP